MKLLHGLIIYRRDKESRFMLQISQDGSRNTLKSTTSKIAHTNFRPMCIFFDGNAFVGTPMEPGTSSCPAHPSSTAQQEAKHLPELYNYNYTAESSGAFVSWKSISTELANSGLCFGWSFEEYVEELTGLQSVWMEVKSKDQYCIF